jgi:hypothetical protein
MRRAAAAVAGAVLLVAWTAPVGQADVIHLANGSRLEVDAWRDAGDAIEFALAGGIVRVLKVEIARIEGSTRSNDLRMYSAPAAASGATARAAEETPAAARAMVDLLREGAALFTQTVLEPQVKAGAFRRLVERWRGLEVPEPLRDAHERAERALQESAEAFSADAEGVAPDARERVEAARQRFAEAQAEIEQFTKEG